MGKAEARRGVHDNVASRWQPRGRLVPFLAWPREARPGGHGQAGWAVGPGNTGAPREWGLHCQKELGHTRDSVAAVSPRGNSVSRKQRALVGKGQPPPPPPSCQPLACPILSACYLQGLKQTSAQAGPMCPCPVMLASAEAGTLSENT